MLVCHPWRFWSGLRLNLNLCSKRGEKKRKKEEEKCILGIQMSTLTSKELYHTHSILFCPLNQL